MIKYFKLIVICLIVSTGLSAQKTKPLTQRWVQLWKDKSGEITYYRKEYKYKNGKEEEVVYTDDKVASVLELLPDQKFTTRYLDFQFGQDCYQLPIYWNGIWQAKGDTVWLLTRMDFNCGWDPTPGTKSTRPKPQMRRIPFLITEFSIDKMSLKCLEYTPTRDLHFISEDAFIELFGKIHKEELMSYNATMYSKLQPTKEGLLLGENGKPFTGTTVVYYRNEHYYKNLNKLLIQEYKNGKQDGIKTSFFANGELKSEVEYKDGEANGTFKRWQETNDGIKLHMEGEMKDGAYFGILKRYGYHNQLESLSEYKEGGKDYSIKHYQYIDGKQRLKSEGNYTVRGKHGKWKYYDKEGKLEREEVYENGMKKQ